MRRATHIQLGLALLVAVLGGFVWWTLSSQTPAAPDTLLPLAPDAVTQIDIRTRDNPVRRFEKRDEHWWMLAPNQGRADDEHLERLAAISAEKVLRWRPASEFDPVKIGLDPPFAVLHINGHELRLGGVAALAPQRYVLVNGHVALIAARYSTDIATTPESEMAQ